MKTSKPCASPRKSTGPCKFGNTGKIGNTGKSGNTGLGDLPRAVRMIASVALAIGVFAAALPALPQAAQAQSCSGWRDPAGTKIVGGNLARLANWPTQAAFRLTNPNAAESLFICGGTAIAPNWVLTAAHCFDELSGSGGDYRDARGWSLDVVLGIDDLAQAGPPQSHAVRQVVLHEGYRRGGAASTGNDIALIELARPWQGAVQRLSLTPASDPKMPPGARLMAAGHGLIEGSGQARRYQRASDGSVFFAGSDKLREVAVPLIDTAICAREYQSYRIGAGQLCAGLEQGGKDSCLGDSGGPLVAFDGENCPYQVGIVSWGIGCAAAKNYGVYTRISHYADWVRQKTGVALLAAQPVQASGASGSDGAQAAEGDMAAADAAIAELERLMGKPDGRLQIQVRGGNTVKLGGRYAFEAASRVAGRLIIIDINSKGVVTQIFPNHYVPDGKARSIGSNETIVIPGRSYGFDNFRATTPVGPGRLLGLVVPEDFPAELLVGAAQRIEQNKGFEPERSPLSYFMNLIDQLNAFLGNRKLGDPFIAGNFALALTPYEIVE